MLLGWPDVAGSMEMQALFTAEVPLDDEADDPQATAYRAALAEVLTRISGSELGGNPAAIDAVFPNPAIFVTQFQPGADNSLWVAFDGDALENVLRGSGYRVWGGERPLTLVWLAVDWGRGEREIIGADDPDRTLGQSRSIDRNRLLRERLLEIAEKRGVPILFPLLDTTDLQSVTFSDIWGGFDGRIVAASQRYDVGSVLIGRVRAATGTQGNRWTYFFSNEDRSWTGSPETVVGRIADLLAKELAVGGNEPVQQVALNVSGIESLDAYGTVEKLLGSVALIENYRIGLVAGDTVSYEVEVRGGAARLRRALRFAGLLEQSDVDSAPETALEFFYSP
jgi:hypothetical protein